MVVERDVFMKASARADGHTLQDSIVGSALVDSKGVRRMSSPSLESQLANCIARYAPPIASQLRAARRRLRRMFPKGFELVYDNYNALVFAFGPTERASQIVLSIAGYPRWVTLFFLRGASLADPDKRLEGSGSQIRGARLDSPKDLDSPALRALIGQAVALAGPAFATAPRLRTVLKAVSAKQRARRPGASVAKSRTKKASAGGGARPRRKAR
jgi:hypothetical protein